MVYLCLCGLAKMLQILNQQENYYVHKTVALPSTSFHKTACCRLPAYRQAGVDIIIFLLIQNLQHLCQPTLNTNTI